MSIFDSNPYGETTEAEIKAQAEAYARELPDSVEIKSQHNPLSDKDFEAAVSEYLKKFADANEDE